MVQLESRGRGREECAPSNSVLPSLAPALCRNSIPPPTSTCRSRPACSTPPPASGSCRTSGERAGRLCLCFAGPSRALPGGCLLFLGCTRWRSAPHAVPSPGPSCSFGAKIFPLGCSGNGKVVLPFGSPECEWWWQGSRGRVRLGTWAAQFSGVCMPWHDQPDFLFHSRAAYCCCAS